MKKTISKLALILFLGVVAFSAQGCKGTTDENSASSEAVFTGDQESGEIIAYYFHATRRCVTCQAVETVAKEAIEEYFGDKVTFKSIDREVEKDNPLLEKYKINGQTLLIIKGAEKVDLTSDGFLNARTNPDKFKDTLKATIEAMM